MKTLFEYITMMCFSIRGAGGNSTLIFHPSTSSAIIMCYSIIMNYLKIMKISAKKLIPIPFFISLVQNNTDYSIESIVTLKFDISTNGIQFDTLQQMVESNPLYKPWVSLYLYNNCIIFEIKTITINRAMLTLSQQTAI